MIDGLAVYKLIVPKRSSIFLQQKRNYIRNCNFNLFPFKQLKIRYMKIW